MSVGSGAGQLERVEDRSTLGVAVSAGVAGAVLLAVGAVLPVVNGAGQPAFGSGPLLVLLAVLPAALAALFTLRRQPMAAAGVLMGAAVLVPGRVLLDVQFLIDSSASTRPERFIPNSLVPLDPAPGLWVLVAGHVITLLAGVLAMRTAKAGSEGSADPIGELGAAGHEDEQPGTDGSGVVGRAAVVPSGTRLNANQRWFVGTVGIAALAVIGVLMTPIESSDPYLVTRPAVESPLFTLLGWVAIAIGVPLAAGVAVSAASRGITRGGLLGLAAALLAVVLPNVASGLASDVLRPTPGPIVALVAALGLAGVALSPAGRDTAADETDGDGAPEREPSMPSEFRLHLVAGVLALLAGAAAWIAAETVHVADPGGVFTADTFAKRMLLPAAALVAVLGVALLVRQFAPAVRPALSVAWVTIPLAGTGALDTVIAATKVSGVQPGPGSVWTPVAMFLALVVAGACAVAGSVDRDESGDGDPRRRAPSVFGYAALAASALLAFGAFGLPTLRAPDYAGADLWSHFRTSSYGLLLALCAVLAATALATRARPARAGALLLGAASLPGLRALELPLTGGRAAGAVAGPGTWLALACAGALVISAAVLLAAPRRR